MATKTFNRGKLLRLAQTGKLVRVDKYSYDETTGMDRSKTELPVRIKTNHDDCKDGFCNLTDWDFKTKSGTAYRNEDGTVVLIVHGNCNFTFRVIV